MLDVRTSRAAGEAAARRAAAFLTSRALVSICTAVAFAYCALWLTTNGGVRLANSSTATQREGGEQAGALATERRLGAASGPPAAGVPGQVALRIQCALPAELWVTDALGRSVGLNPATRLVRLEIPRAAYSGHGTNPQLVTLPNASGAYQVTLVGLSSGLTRVTIQASRPGDLAHISRFSGGAPIAAGQQLSGTVRVTLTSSAAPQLSVTNLHTI
ncbi:MAG: hypothetical protein ACRDHX_05935 [Chloroflexota bacterium]